MNDFMYEQLVARKAKASVFLIRILVIALVAVLFFLGPLFIGFIAPPLAIVLAAAAAFLIFPKLNVEYEYILLNHDMQIDVIYNKSRRKTLLEFDIRKIEAITRNSSAPGIPQKTYDFSTGRNTDQVYAVTVPVDQQSACILLEPDDTMKEHMNSWLPRHMQFK